MNSRGQINGSRVGTGKTTIMKAELVCMVERFPNLKETIISLYQRNEEFQTLCFDYFLCLKSLEQWVTNMQKDEKFVLEYSELRKTLETELFQYIDKEDQKTT